MRRLVFIAGLGLALSACERVPEIERKIATGKNSDQSRHLLEVRKWLWTCRGFSNNSAFTKGRKEIGEQIEEFVDYFQTKGLSTITSEEPSSILGTAILWKESGYLVAGGTNFSEMKNIECSNGLIPWTKVSIKGFDHALDLVVLKLDMSVLPQIKTYIRWAVRSDAILLDEYLSVIASAFPGQVDRLSVQTQPFPSSMHTGIDEDLILFLPRVPEVLGGGLLVDSSMRAVGYLLPKQSGPWGLAVTVKRVDFSINSIVEKGSVPLPYAGLKLRYASGKFIVQQIEVGSPSYRAGLRVDDIVLKWDRRDLKQLSDWQEMSVKDIGHTIPLTYQRGEKTFEAQMILTIAD